MWHHPYLDAGAVDRMRVSRVYFRAAIAMAAALLSFAPAVFAQTQSTLRVTSTIPSGVLNGTVMTDRTERPLLNATVSIPRLRLSAKSDSVGDFRITGVPAGSHEVLVELNGFEPMRSSFDFSDGEKISVDFVLTERVIQRAAKTAAQKAVDNVDISRMGLEERRNMGAGRYITAEELAKSNGKMTADVIASKVPGLHSVKLGGNARALAASDNDNKVEPSEADRKAGAKADCYVQVLLNGNLIYERANGNTLFDINSVPVSMIISADYFTLAQTPPEHRTESARCGTVQIQTRGR